MSFFSLSSPSVVTQPRSDNESDIARARAAMLAVPAGLANSRAITIRNVSHLSGRTPRSERSRGGHPRADVISKTFNTLASMPLAIIRNRPAVLEATLSLTSINALTSSTIASAYVGQAFSLNDFFGRTEYTTLFDQYKFLEFEAWLIPNVSQSTVMANTGTLVTAVDLDDNNTPSSVSGVQDKQNAVVSSGYDGHYHRWVPHMAVAAYSGAFTSFTSQSCGWLDCASPSIQMYGLKYAVTATTTAITYNLTLRARVLFKQPGI